MDSDAVLEGRDVVIRGGLIEQIGVTGESLIPGDADIVDAGGRFLMPGLFDCHVHTDSSIASPNWARDLFLYVANGVTSIRCMWAVKGTLEARQAVQSGTVAAPRMFCSSPGMDGPDGRYSAFQPPVASPLEARRLVALYRSLGYDFIKVYTTLSADVYFAICEEARSRGIPVVGHVPFAVKLWEAAEAGQYSSEHLLGAARLVSPTGWLSSAAIDWRRVEDVAALVAGSPMWKCATLAVRQYLRGDVPALEARPEMRFVSPEMLARFRSPIWPLPSGRGDEMPNAQAVQKTMSEAGVKLIAGTDAGVMYVLPGYSLHDELRLCVEGGLSPYAALRMATVDAAEFLGKRRQLGTVEPGKVADLVLLGGNPLEDIRQTANLSGVMLSGRWLPASELDCTLSDQARYYGRA
jgi:hypothetical protein